MSRSRNSPCPTRARVIATRSVVVIVVSSSTFFLLHFGEYRILLLAPEVREQERPIFPLRRLEVDHIADVAFGRLTADVRM